MGKVISAILGGRNKSNVSTQPIQETVEEKKKARKSRITRVSTSGGVAGQELQPGSTGGTDNVFGN